MFFILSLFVLIATPCTAKNVLPVLQPIKEKYIGQTLQPIMKKNKWGYANSEGKILIKPEFEAAKDYSDGLAFIQFDGKWGIINEIPAYVVKPIYDDIKNFEGDFAIVVKEGKYGIINKSARICLPAEYDEIRYDSFFKNISFARKDNHWDFIDNATGMIKYKMGYADIVTNDGPYAKVKKGDKWGLLSNEVKYVSPIAYDQVKYNSEGYYSVQQNGLHGAINLKGEYLLPCEFAQEPQLTSAFNIYIANGKTYLANTEETRCWVLSYNFNNPQMADLTIDSGSLLTEQILDNNTKLATYNNIPAYITYKDKCVWSANDNIKNQFSTPVSMEYKEGSIQLTNYFRANKNDATYSMEQEIDIRYPESTNDFRISAAKIQKTIFYLCTKQDMPTPAKVAEYYIEGYHLGYCEDYEWIPIVQNQVALAKNQWKSSLHASIQGITNGIMSLSIKKELNFGDAQPNTESIVYQIDMKTGKVLK